MSTTTQEVLFAGGWLLAIFVISVAFGYFLSRGGGNR